MKKARYTESQIFKILKEAESGIAVPELSRNPVIGFLQNPNNLAFRKS
jgi:hypothetical protein